MATKNKKHDGFSLVELIVVIAIVGILAAIAVPSYKQYIFRTTFATLNQNLDIIENKMIMYYEKNGTFGTAYDLGLSNTPGSTIVDLSQFPAGALPAVDVIAVSVINSCAGILDVSIQPYNLGLPGIDSESDAYMLLGYVPYATDGVMKSFRFFEVYVEDVGPSYPDLPGFVNIYVPPAGYSNPAMSVIGNIVCS